LHAVVTSTLSTSRLVALVAAVLAVVCGIVFAATEAFSKEQTRVQRLGAGVEQVLVHADAGDVTLVGSTEPNVIVRSESHWLLRKPRVTARRRGELLVLRGDCPAQALRARCSADFTVEVPFDVDVSVDGDAGDIKVNDLAGNIRLKTNAGDIMGSGLQPATVRVHTDAGKVGLAFDTSPALIDAFSDAGDIGITVPAGEYRIDTATKDGQVTLDGVLRNDRSVRRIVAETRAGNVAIRGRG
jgi:hypothetical protein